MTHIICVTCVVLALIVLIFMFLRELIVLDKRYKLEEESKEKELERKQKWEAFIQRQNEDSRLPFQRFYLDEKSKDNEHNRKMEMKKLEHELTASNKASKSQRQDKNKK